LPACNDDPAVVAGSQCATLQVPVDWNHPDRPTFGLAIARRTAKNPQARVGSLVFGPGGPGDSGVDRIKTGMSRFSADLQDRFAANPGRRTRERSASHLRRLGPRQLQLKPLRADHDRQLPDLKGRPETRYRLSRRESQSHQPRRVHETEPPSPGMGKGARRHCGNQASTRSASWTRVRLAPCSTRSVNALS
jgi:hypothetical protein